MHGSTRVSSRQPASMSKRSERPACPPSSGVARILGSSLNPNKIITTATPVVSGTFVPFAVRARFVVFTYAILLIGRGRSYMEEQHGSRCLYRSCRGAGSRLGRRHSDRHRLWRRLGRRHRLDSAVV